MSPAPYAHQWQTKPRILGRNLGPVLIRSHLLPMQTCYSYDTFPSPQVVGRRKGWAPLFIGPCSTVLMAKQCTPLSHTIFSQERDLYLHPYLPQPTSFRHPSAFEAQTCSSPCQSLDSGAQDGLRSIGLFLFCFSHCVHTPQNPRRFHLLRQPRYPISRLYRLFPRPPFGFCANQDRLR